MTDSKHTPTPWLVEHCEQKDGTVLTWIGAWDGPSAGVADLYHRTAAGGFYVKDNAEANAAHIVRCVNAHDELVEALRKIEALNAEQDEALARECKVGGIARAARHIARAALAKAEAGLR